MSKTSRSIASFALALTLPFPLMGVAAASPTPATHVLQASASQQLSPEKQAFLDHVAGASKTFVDHNGKIATTASDQKLASEYGFTQQEILLLHRSVLGKPSHTGASQHATFASRDGSAVCFSHDDLLVGAGAAIVAASEAGPVAIAAALEAAATAFGGPVGTAIGAVLAVASAPSLIEIGGRAVTAVATNRGLKIGIHADYPPVYADYC